MKPLVLEVVLRMPEPCGLSAAQRRWCMYAAASAREWLRRKMPARGGNLERARQMGVTN